MQGEGHSDADAAAANRLIEVDGASANRDTVPATDASPAARAVGSFRPDIEGMRAIAVSLVLLSHGYRQSFSGGFVGVDVFFVISGFLITGLLVNERNRTGRVSLRRFYARRVRRILPASTVLVVITICATYYWLGFIAGNDVADDGSWTALFSANIHFALVGTDYFAAQVPPSPLQHMWSLGVEEQFYLVWPALFAAVAVLVRGVRHHAALAAALLVIIGVSAGWSVWQTAVNQTWAYFSPLTRAWELGAGALVAVLAPTIPRSRTTAWAAQVLAMCGLAGIVLSALLYTPSTPYPGVAAMLPVIGGAVLIAVGCLDRATVIGRALSVRPMQWLGARSYSLYLWHWPLLVIPAQYLDRPLTGLESTGWLLLAVVVAALSYRFVENPVRRSRLLASDAGLSLALGLLLVIGTIGVAQALIVSHHGTWKPLIGVFH